MDEVLPGVYDWTALHPRLGSDVHSHAVDGTLIDPMLPAEGIDALAFEPRRILLVNRHHDRDAGRLSEELGIPVLCHRDGLHEFAEKPLDPQPYGHGDEVAPGLRAYNVLPSWPDECALHVPDRRLLVIADTLVRDERGGLAFVPDRYLGENPEEEKQHLRAGLRGLLALDFDHLLFGHGAPWIGGARAAVAEFVQG